MGISKNLDNQDIIFGPCTWIEILNKKSTRQCKSLSLKRRKIFEGGDDEGRRKRSGDVDNDRQLTDGKTIEQSATGMKRQRFAM